VALEICLAYAVFFAAPTDFKSSAQGLLYGLCMLTATPFVVLLVESGFFADETRARIFFAATLALMSLTNAYLLLPYAHKSVVSTSSTTEIIRPPLRALTEWRPRSA
jgi:hypothetical protein